MCDDNNKPAIRYVGILCLQESDEEDESGYRELIEQVGWFFFDLFVLGYVEDPATGKSFQFPLGLKWKIYVEVSIL